MHLLNDLFVCKYSRTCFTAAKAAPRSPPAEDTALLLSHAFVLPPPDPLESLSDVTTVKPSFFLTENPCQITDYKVRKKKKLEAKNFKIRKELTRMCHTKQQGLKQKLS